MGLDQYIHKNIKNEETGEWEQQEYHYWRKNNQIQGWFEEHYDQENCEETEITVEVCDKIIDDLKNEGLKPTSGFFYGKHVMEEEELENTIKLFENIKQELEHEDCSFSYYCWY